MLLCELWYKVHNLPLKKEKLRYCRLKQLIKEYLDAGHNPDAPVHFVPYLIEQKDVHTYLFPEKRYDIGNVESYEHAQEILPKQCNVIV